MTVGRLLGVRIVLNRYFLGLLLLLGVGGLLPEAVAVFAVVFVHEFGHVLAAKAWGLPVSEVELLPFGGVARIDELLEIDPSIEISVALAGPLTNLLLVGAAWAEHVYLGALPGEWSRSFIEINALVGGFNLLPALPLDGGRILRAKLSRRIGFRRATERTAKVGKGIAVLLGLIGGVLLYAGRANVSLMVVAFFLFSAAGKEESLAAYVFMRSLARRSSELRKARTLPSRHLVATVETPIKEVLMRFVPKEFHVVWVLDAKGGLVGLATEIDLIHVAFEAGMETPVERAIQPFRSG